MNKVVFKILISGMSKRNLARNIIIYKPYKTFKAVFRFKNTHRYYNYKISQLLGEFKKTSQFRKCDENYYTMDELTWDSVYIKQKHSLLSFQSDKRISDVFDFFKKRKLEIVYVFVAGGASTWCSGYQFVVHPNEAVHKHKPHVHVVKDDMSVRYSLETLERFPQDVFRREYKRDEKKIIIPALKKNQKKLWDYWNCYMGGYCSPTIDCQGKEYYKES